MRERAGAARVVEERAQHARLWHVEDRATIAELLGEGVRPCDVDHAARPTEDPVDPTTRGGNAIDLVRHHGVGAEFTSPLRGPSRACDVERRVGHEMRVDATRAQCAVELAAVRHHPHHIVPARVEAETGQGEVDRGGGAFTDGRLCAVKVRDIKRRRVTAEERGHDGGADSTWH